MSLPRSSAVAVVLMLSACGREQPPPRVSAAIGRPARGPPARLSAADFVATSGSIDLFAIRSSELALERSSSPHIRQLAESMIRDHKGTSGQLSLEGRRLNLLPSATLRPTEQRMFDQLQVSSRFDADYISDQRSVHQQAVALDQAFAANGRSPTLQAVAALALSTEQRHLRLLERL